MEESRRDVLVGFTVGIVDALCNPMLLGDIKAVGTRLLSYVR